jgi:hypothetical protein
MKRIAILTLSSSLLVPGCTGDGGGGSSDAKAVVDADALQDGVTVLLSGDLGNVEVAFSTPVPEVDDAQLQAELDGAVSLLVINDDSGVSADLVSGTPLGGEPAGPGEYTWTLSSMRDTAILTFYNETDSGSVLRVDGAYTGTMQIATNAYVESVTALAFPVDVQ